MAMLPHESMMLMFPETWLPEAEIAQSDGYWKVNPMPM
jgi:hypothetical protein